MMLKFENTANIGDTIKAYDFEPMEGRQERYLVGKVIDKGQSRQNGCSSYTVKITQQSEGNVYEIGQTVCVPFECTFDYDERVQKIETKTKTNKEIVRELIAEMGIEDRKALKERIMNVLSVTKANAGVYIYNAIKQMESK